MPTQEPTKRCTVHFMWKNTECEVDWETALNKLVNERTNTTKGEINETHMKIKYLSSERRSFKISDTISSYVFSDAIHTKNSNAEKSNTITANHIWC